MYKKAKIEPPTIPASGVPPGAGVPATGISFPPAYPYKPNTYIPPSAAPMIPIPLPIFPSNRKRLVIIYDKKPRFSHTKNQLKELEFVTPLEQLITIELQLLEDKKLEIENPKPTPFQYLNIIIEYNDEFEHNLKIFCDFLEANPKIFAKIPDIAYHIHFDYDKNWLEVTQPQKDTYFAFLKTLSTHCSEQIKQCSILNKYELNTIYLTGKEDLAKLGQEIQEDLQNWPNLKVCDYGENFIRFFPGVKFPDSLETLNIGEVTH